MTKRKKDKEKEERANSDIKMEGGSKEEEQTKN